MYQLGLLVERQKTPKNGRISPVAGRRVARPTSGCTGYYSALAQSNLPRLVSGTTKPSARWLVARSFRKFSRIWDIDLRRKRGLPRSAARRACTALSRWRRGEPSKSRSGNSRSGDSRSGNSRSGNSRSGKSRSGKAEQRQSRALADWNSRAACAHGLDPARSGSFCKWAANWQPPTISGGPQLDRSSAKPSTSDWCTWRLLQSRPRSLLSEGER